MFEFVGFGAGQVIRLGSNLALSRWLFPEAFGLSALVSILNQGLMLLSDVGLATVIVQSKRGDDARFLNTAFTWQAIRGVLIFLCALALTIPFANLYGEPQLKVLVPVGASVVLLLGVRSTGIFSLRRTLNVAPLNVIELLSQIASVALMMSWALWQPSVWTLVGGMVFSCFVGVVLSHFLPGVERNRFEWDRDCAREIFGKGKWLAGSSALTFASQQGDRLLLGHYLGAAALGVYSIAFFLSSALGDAMSRVTMGVFYPAYSRVQNEDAGRLRSFFYKTRLALDGLALPGLGALAVLGPWVITALYDHRYEEAGWMLRILTVRVALNCLGIASQYCLFALGKTQYGFYMNLARAVGLLVFVPTLYARFGVHGLVWGVALCELPALAVTQIGLIRSGVFSFVHELRAPLGSAAGVGVGAGCLWLMAYVGLA
jgi:O-antigen/teichoic acid export membrane protein